MHHAAVTVLHQVARLAVDATCTGAVSAEEVRVQRINLAVPPWRWQEHQLRNTDADSIQKHVHAQTHCGGEGNKISFMLDYTETCTYCVN